MKIMQGTQGNTIAVLEIDGVGMDADVASLVIGTVVRQLRGGERRIVHLELRQNDVRLVSVRAPADFAEWAIGLEAVLREKVREATDFAARMDAQNATVPTVGG
jgi:hypothetical protein